MPVFIYTIEQAGKLIKKEIKAPSIQLAQIRLKTRNIDPVYITEKPLMPFFSGGGRISKKTVLFFTRQMSFLLEAGISLMQAIEMCAAATEDRNFKVILKTIQMQLEGGKSFSRCLQTRPDVFDGFYVNMVVCAEKTGMLGAVLHDLANYIEKSNNITSKVKSAMMYPSVILITSFVIVLGVVVFVVPKFEDIYSGGNTDLPGLTQSLIVISNLLRNNAILMLMIAIGAIIFFYQFIRTEQGKTIFIQVVKSLPVFGKIYYQASMVRFFRCFYSLLKAGVNFIEALDISHNVASDHDVKRGITMSKNFIIKGKSFAKGLENSKAFPPLVYQMAKIGEESGKLDHTFQKLTTYYEIRLNHLISGMIQMIEPLLIVILASIIGIIVLALYLPIFNMGAAIQ